MSSNVPNVCRLYLLGDFVAESDQGGAQRWSVRAVAALLARLALAPTRAHAREELVELIWPGVDLRTGRNRLRQALATLRKLVEPLGCGELLEADHLTLRLRPGMVWCDAVAFEQALRSGDVGAARALYRGELMPGYYDAWLVDERQRLGALRERLDEVPVMPPPPPQAMPQPLPAYWTRVYGIEARLQRLHELVRHERLVTVVGPGGCGKTRLAVQLARTLHDRGTAAQAAFTDVVFVPLASCRTPEQALDALAAALHIHGKDPLAAIVAAMGERRTLVVLDNAEQLVPGCHELLRTLLMGWPGLHLLVTSRRRLDIDGERVFELDGLATPAPDADRDGDALLGHDAVALFVDRAAAAGVDLGRDPGPLAAVAALVRHLGGMPLAIELAASRVRSFTPRELLQRMQHGGASSMLDTLQRPGHNPAADRHASMRRTLQWSLELLDPAALAMLQAMTVLMAPARTETVAALAALAPEQALLRLESLRDASLVQSRRDAAGALRHSLLQSVREAVAEGVGAAQAVTLRHRLRQALTADAPALRQQHPSVVAMDVPLVLGALHHASADGAADAAAEMIVAYLGHWMVDMLEPVPQSTMVALEALVNEVGATRLRCRIHALLCMSRGATGFGAEAYAHAERAVAAADDDHGRALARLYLAWSMLLTGRVGAALDAEADRALALAVQSGDAAAEALALRVKALVMINVHQQHAEAEPLMLRAQRLWERIGHRRGAFRRLVDRANCWGWCGRWDEAATALAAGERALHADGDLTGAWSTAWVLGRAYCRMRRFDEAAAALRRMIAGSRDRHALLLQASGLLHLGDALVMLGQPEAAARLHGFGVAYWQRQFGAINTIEATELRKTRRLLRLALGAAQAEALRLEGAAMGLQQAVELALNGGVAAG